MINVGCSIVDVLRILNHKNTKSEGMEYNYER